jgi:4-hydroxybenzoate polyprenyltransferase
MREVNNLAVTLSMMVAFGLPWPEILYRSAFALVLNILAYLINDYCDISVDLTSPQKNQLQVQLMAQNRGATLGALVSLALLLTAGGLLHSWHLVIAFLSSALVVLLYSAWLKSRPFVDLLLMIVAGATGTMIGIPAYSPLGWKLLGLLALFSGCYESIQVIRDEPADRLKKVTTTAVFLGVKTTAWIYRLLIISAALFGLLLLRSPVPLALLLAAFVPLTPGQAARSWDMVRLILGSTWIGLMAQLYLGYL